MTLQSEGGVASKRFREQFRHIQMEMHAVEVKMASLDSRRELQCLQQTWLNWGRAMLRFPVRRNSFARDVAVNFSEMKLSTKGSLDRLADTHAQSIKKHKAAIKDHEEDMRQDDKAITAKSIEDHKRAIILHEEYMRQDEKDMTKLRELREILTDSSFEMEGAWREMEGWCLNPRGKRRGVTHTGARRLGALDTPPHCCFAKCILTVQFRCCALCGVHLLESASSWFTRFKSAPPQCTFAQLRGAPRVLRVLPLGSWLGSAHAC